jgi:hypothetical protein
MHDRLPEPDALLNEFRRERSIRRTVTVLEAKRKRIRQELQQLVRHIALLVPAAESKSVNQSQSDLLAEAAKRLGDEAFAQLLLQILQESN